MGWGITYSGGLVLNSLYCFIDCLGFASEYVQINLWLSPPDRKLSLGIGDHSRSKLHPLRHTFVFEFKIKFENQM